MRGSSRMRRTAGAVVVTALAGACGGGSSSPPAPGPSSASESQPATPTSGAAGQAQGACGLVSAAEMAQASGLVISSTGAPTSPALCIYKTAPGGGSTSGSVQLLTFTGADYDAKAAQSQADGTSFGPVSGVGTAAYETGTGLFVKVNADHAFQIYLSGAQFIADRAALQNAELAIARLVASRIGS